MPPRQTACALRECRAGAECSRYLLMKAGEERRQTSWYDNKLGVDTERHSATWNPSLLWSKWQSHFRVNSGFSVLQCWFTSYITMVTHAPQPTSQRGFCVREGRYIDLCLSDYYCFQPVGLIPAELHWLQLPICPNARLCLRTRSWTPWVELMSSMSGSTKQDKKKISDPCLKTHTDTFNVPVLYLVSLHPNE